MTNLFLFLFFYRIKEFTVDLVNSYQEIVSYCHKFYTSIELVRQNSNFLASGNSIGTFR